jgi:hypothetical protein
LGYLDRGHYNFSDLKKHHYNSPILKFAYNSSSTRSLPFSTSSSCMDPHVIPYLLCTNDRMWTKTCTDYLSTR